jgi:hypothetical protein
MLIERSAKLQNDAFSTNLEIFPETTYTRLILPCFPEKISFWTAYAMGCCACQ